MHPTGGGSAWPLRRLPGEARAAYEHAWALEGDGAEETDARELLDELDD